MDSTNANAGFNYALYQWRGGQIAGKGAEDFLKNIKDDSIRERYVSDIKSEGCGSLKIKLHDYGKCFHFSVQGFDRDVKRVCGLKRDAADPNAHGLKAEMKRTTFQVFDCATGKLLFGYQSDQSSRHDSISLSPDGNYVAITHHDPDKPGINDDYHGHMTSVFEIKTGRKKQSFSELENGRGIFSPDSRFILFENYNRTLVYRLSDGMKTDEFRDGQCIDRNMFSPDGRIVLKKEPYSGGICIAPFDTDTGKIGDRSYALDSESFNAVAFSKDGSHMLAASWHHMYLIDISGTDIKVLKQFDTDRTAPLLDDVLYLSGGKYIASFSDYYPDPGRIKANIWDIESGQYFVYENVSAILADRESDALRIENECSVSEISFSQTSRAEYKLSTAESTKQRQDAQGKYDALLTAAQKKYAAGETDAALAFIDTAAQVPGYGASAELLRLRYRYARGLTKTGIRKIVPVEEPAPAKKERVEPTSEFSEKIRPELNRLLNEMIEACSERFSEFETESRLESAESGGKFFLYRLRVKKSEVSNCPLNYEVNEGTWFGAAVFDEDGKLLFAEKNLYNTSLYGDAPYIGLCPGGEYLLCSAPGFSAALILIDIPAGARHTLLNGTFDSLCFTPDKKYVICKSRQNKVSVVSLETLSVWAEYEFPEQYGDIYTVDDNSFAILRDGEYRLCLIDWRYEPETPGDAGDPSSHVR